MNSLLEMTIILVGVYFINNSRGRTSFTVMVGLTSRVSYEFMFFFYELTNKPLEHTPPVISEDSLHNHLGICSEGLLVRSWNLCMAHRIHGLILFYPL